jgi:hypothetical protein
MIDETLFARNRRGDGSVLHGRVLIWMLGCNLRERARWIPKITGRSGRYMNLVL